MKKIFSNSIVACFVTLTILFVTGCKDKVDDNKTNVVEQKNELGLVSGKPNIIFLTQNGCGTCDELKNTLKESSVNAILESKFKLIFLEASNIDLLPKNLEEPIGTPTVYFVDSNANQLIEPLSGSTDAESFKALMDEALKAYEVKISLL